MSDEQEAIVALIDELLAQKRYTSGERADALDDQIWQLINNE